MKFIVPVVLFLLLFGGCRTSSVRTEPIDVSVTDTVRLRSAPLVEALLAREWNVIHAVNGSWKDRVFSAECVMKTCPDGLKIIFLAPQMRLVTITLTKPHRVTCVRAPQVPAAFEPEYALADLAFVNLETDTLRQAFGPAFRIEDNGTERRLWADGQTIAVLTRQPDGRLELRNLVRGYTYTLRAAAR